MKDIMKKTSTNKFEVEKELFHGTKKDTCEKINYQGFNRSFAGENGNNYKC